LTTCLRPRLVVSLLVTTVLLAMRWFFSSPAAVASFLSDPLMGLSDSPILPIICALLALLARELLGERAPRLFAEASWMPALVIASMVLVATPFHFTSGILFGTVFIAASAACSLCSNRDASDLLATADGVRGIFFISGMAALIYQVAWQKKLISLLGADGQAVTVIVAVFLGGLGVGALIGDKLAPSLGTRRGIAVFCAIELVAGVFGAASMFWLDWIGSLAARSFSPAVLIAASVAAIGLPTVLMGITLPILVEALKGRSTGLKENVAKLYALNALGSAVASLLAATMLFQFVGLIGATWIAATLNALTAYLVFIAARNWVGLVPEHADKPHVPSPEAVRELNLPWQHAALLAGLTGFVTIGQEVILLRMMAWSSGGAPWTFGLGVGTFLLGLGYGSLRIARLPTAGLLAEGCQVWLGTALAALLMPALAALLGGMSTPAAGTFLLAATLGVIGFLGGSSLPLISGQIRPDSTGNSHFGAVYSVNILGSVVGAILTGYILFDVLTTAQCVAMSATFSLLTGGTFVWFARGRQRIPLFRCAVLTGMVMCALPLHGWLYRQWREWLFQGTFNVLPFSDTMETHAGIIAVQPDERGAVVVGGGAYDGRFNVDPLHDSNLILRPYTVMALLPEPARVLQIGLASGSWAKVMLSFPTVREFRSVEINSGYLRIIADNKEVSDILADRRASYTIADGRKWLLANDQKWDVIVINNTFHWREGATFLNSHEFMELARSRLVPGGILFLNTTGSHAISATALKEFPEVYQISNGIAAVNGRLPAPDAVTLGKRLAKSSLFARHGLDEAMSIQWISQRLPVVLDRQRYAECEILTDDAMATEWGKRACLPVP
jgi:predicted membrane-bound spermidine synthase